MRALDFGDFDELVRKYGAPSAVFPLPARELTGSSLVLTPHRQSHHVTEDTARVNNWEEIPSCEE
jgi:hypothetical protein